MGVLNCYEMQESQSSRQINQEWIATLGGVSRYKDPKDSSYEGTIPWSQIPSRSTRWWRSSNQPPIHSATWPGVGYEDTKKWGHTLISD